MSGADSTDRPFDELSPTVLAAARGELPEWSRASPKRREHMGRVASLLESWAHDLKLGEAEILRWAAVGWLHDALRDADPAELVHLVRAEERDLPPRILHGPAAAARLHGEVEPRLLDAIRYHTTGHPTLDRLGRALYLADFLEPGRKFSAEWRGELRERMPRNIDEVLVEVLSARIRNLLDRRTAIRPETAAFWSSLVGGGA